MLLAPMEAVVGAMTVLQPRMFPPVIRIRLRSRRIKVAAHPVETPLLVRRGLLFSGPLLVPPLRLLLTFFVPCIPKGKTAPLCPTLLRGPTLASAPMPRGNGLLLRRLLPLNSLLMTKPWPLFLLLTITNSWINLLTLAICLMLVPKVHKLTSRPVPSMELQF